MKIRIKNRYQLPGDKSQLWHARCIISSELVSLQHRIASSPPVIIAKLVTTYKRTYHEQIIIIQQTSNVLPASFTVPLYSCSNGISESFAWTNARIGMKMFTWQNLIELLINNIKQKQEIKYRRAVFTFLVHCFYLSSLFGFHRFLLGFISSLSQLAWDKNLVFRVISGLKYNKNM
jgi:hypothetical protein